MELSIVKNNFIKYIDKIVENNKISHAYLIEIDDYDSDYKFILDFIKMIISNCSYQETLNSNNKDFLLIDDNNYPDIKVIEADGNWIKKSQLLDLQKDYSNKSLLGNKRFYIIKNAEKLNSSSANTMLKFLEEPEEDIVAILLTDNRYHIIDTILSRCQVLVLKDSYYKLDDENQIVDLLDCILNPNSFFIKYNYLISEIVVDKNSFKEKIIEIENILIDYLNNKYIYDSEYGKSIFEIIKKIPDNQIIKYISILEEEVPKLDFNVNYKLWLDSLFSKLVGGIE